MLTSWIVKCGVVPLLAEAKATAVPDSAFRYAFGFRFLKNALILVNEKWLKEVLMPNPDCHRVG